jgi:glutamate N-acetyltransferase/amino-acid N-acetyltransferase
MTEITEIRTPEGFRFATAEAAIKKPGRKDLALIFSETEAAMAAVFTTNKVKAAPVRLCMQRIQCGRGQAILINSGNANACTGDRGVRDAAEMADLVAAVLKIPVRSAYVCSTGVIGTPMPMDRVRRTVPKLADTLGKGTVADIAAAIMTTDTFPKMAHGVVKLGGKVCTITGICKGAGMIAPDMATMLGFIMTDARVAATALKRVLRDAVTSSFNTVTVDGDMSTNDTVIMMANGAAGNRQIIEESRDYRAFAAAVTEVASALSRMIVKDGEGATKIVRIHVRNAKSDREAQKAARAVAGSLLVKTAMYGNDANWGRIMAALGRAGVSVEERNVDILLNGLKIVSRGIGTGRDNEANQSLRTDEVLVTIDLREGSGRATVLTCDLTEEYIKINAEYRT